MGLVRDPDFPEKAGKWTLWGFGAEPRLTSSPLGGGDDVVDEGGPEESLAVSVGCCWQRRRKLLGAVYF